MHSNDFLVRLLNGAFASDPVVRVDGQLTDQAPARTRPDGVPLETVAGDPARFERLAVRRSTRLATSRVRSFGARRRSLWALDVIAERFTHGMHDWNSLRSVATRFSDSPREFDPTLDRMKLKDLWTISELLHVRSLDPEAEKAVLKFIAMRTLGGKEFDKTLNELLIERLLYSGLADPARALVSRLDGSTWRKHVLAVDLEHPRFGGSYASLLLALNSGFYRYGMERIEIKHDSGTPFQRLGAESGNIVSSGPLVSVILETANPTTRTAAAIRSVIDQTYQNWELIVVADSSGRESGLNLDEIAVTDSRIRVVRSKGNVDRGKYERRNEALGSARGEFVTFQDEGSWSHPRRIETQVRDLNSDPDKLANMVRMARVGEDFSLVGTQGAKLMLSESSLLFRRAPVIARIGYFDSVRKGAATEFRKRLEAESGTKVGLVGPEVPMQFISTATSGDSQVDFELGMWIDPEWLSYRDAAARFHNRIISGEASAYIPYSSEAADLRPFSAPAQWLRADPERVKVDVLVVLDGQRSRERSEFIDAVVDELYCLTASGARVAILHSESAGGADRPGPIADGLRELVDSGRVARVFSNDEVEAELVVIRHAVAAQGHSSVRRPITTNNVVVVEDFAGGDMRGETFASVDVNEIVQSWFGTLPTWVGASPLLPRPILRSVVVEDEAVRITVSASDTHQVKALRLSSGSDYFELEVELNENDELVASGMLGSLPEGELLVSVVRSDDQIEFLQGCHAEPRKVVTTRSSKLVIASDRLLRILPLQATQELPGSADFADRYLSTRVTLARIFRDQIELTMEHGPDTSLVAVHLLREVDGHLRRHEFKLDDRVADLQSAIRTLDGIVDTRWKIFGVFQTPLGPVSAPLEFNRTSSIRDSKYHRIRRLESGGVGIIHIVEQSRPSAIDHIPALSVVMPVFNVAPFLDTAIRSVLTQDFQDFELIIVDDASTDGGRQVIEMHRSLDDRIKVIALDHNTLGGAGVPSNLGIRAARGKYIGFVDSDDWVTKPAFAKMVELAETHDAELVVGDFRTFDENDRTVSEAYDAERWRSIPLEQVISASSHPALMRLSPVPWRKLYRRDFVQAHQVQYPEGDYFYEDNPLHWHVLSRAERVVASDEIISYHRMAREGQTMGAFEYKLGAIASHANTTLTSLRGTTVNHREVLFEEFIDYVSRQRWTVKRQTQPAAAKMIQRRLASIYDGAREAEPNAEVPQATVSHFAGYREAYPDYDLTIVIPVYNSADLIRDTLDSVLKIDGLSYDVLLIDDGSTDSSLEILREYERKHSNVHVFEQKNRGAGRARNAVIPLCTGRFTYFLDADDVVDPMALRQAVNKADQDEADLLFIQYRIEYTDENRSRGMFDADAEIWQRLPYAAENGEKQALLSGLINYPWNRIIRTSLLHDANIFFGPTIVHNDVLYHWHTILSAANIKYLDVEVCTHRKFTNRTQVTNINDERRMAVLEALRGTHERIAELNEYPRVSDQWRKFAIELLDWAKNRIPGSLQEAYRDRSEALEEQLNADVKD